MTVQLVTAEGTKMADSDNPWTVNRHITVTEDWYRNPNQVQPEEAMSNFGITEGKATAGGLKTPSNSKRSEKPGGSELVPSSPTPLDLSNLRNQFEAWMESARGNR